LPPHYRRKMFRIFFRKRFVCGHIAYFGADEKSESFKIWNTSFNFAEDAKKWFKFYMYKPVILYDRKTKCLIKTRNLISIYFNEIKEEND